MAMDLVANWSKVMTEEMKADQRVLCDDELADARIDALSTAHAPMSPSNNRILKTPDESGSARSP